MLTTLSRSDFDLACRHFLEKYNSTSDPICLAGVLQGWTWNEHISHPGLGYMSRPVLVCRRSRGEPSDNLPELALEYTDLELVIDDAMLSQLDGESEERLTCNQYVVYSPSFQVPAFYFTIHDSNGSPLDLNNLVNTSLFHPFAFERAEMSSFALGLPASTFPLLSQGDHPSLGTPSWYIHPCESAAAVGEVMEELQQMGTPVDDFLLRWLETWFMVLGTIVDLRN